MRNQNIEKTLNIVGVDTAEAALKSARIPVKGEPLPWARDFIVDGKPEVEQVNADLFKIHVAVKARPKAKVEQPQMAKAVLA